VIADNPAWWQQFLQEHVSILAMNEEEGEALTGFADPLSADKSAGLGWCCAPPAGPVYGGLPKKRRSENPASAAAGGDPGV
jgi:inosine kinase